MILSVTLGTAGLIVIVTMGRDVKTKLNRDLDLLGGATRIKVTFEDAVTDQNVVPKPEWFRPETLDALRLTDGVSRVSVIALKVSPAFSSILKRGYWFNLTGVGKDFWEVNSFSALRGELFDDRSVAERRRVCVLGANLARRIFGTVDIIGYTIPIDRDLYVVTGVLGGAGIGDRTDFAFIPLTTAQDRVQGLSLPYIAYIRCRTWDDVRPVTSAIPERVQAHQSIDRLRVEVAWDQLDRVRRIAWWMEFFIYVSITATLILGGFGIWNGMMATVQSRTREIGLKKAIGAEDRDIMVQFLTESLCLSLGSAVLGVALGRAAMEIIGTRLGSNPPEDLLVLSVVLSLIFSVVLGVGAGFAPSVLASRMEVVSALRYE